MRGILMQREGLVMYKLDFNGDWKVWKELDAFELVFRVPKDAKKVTLPYDAMIHEKQQKNSRNGGKTGALDGAVYKFYKRFFVPEDYQDKNVRFHFEGIYMNAFIYINQSLAGSCVYGYTDFFVDANDYLKYGQENEILVLVKNSAMPNSRWYSGSGIYRPVWMCVGEKSYIVPYSLRLTTKALEYEPRQATEPDTYPGRALGAVVEIEGMLSNSHMKAVWQQAVIEICTPDGVTILQRKYPVRIKGGENIHLRKSIYVENPRLWCEEDPALYKVKLLIKDGEKVVDEDNIITGIRQIFVDARHGLRVNGRSVKLRGACIHHDQGLLGAATYDDYEYRRVRLLKAAGFNAVRSAHNPASQALLRACDALGMYVMDEFSDVWTKNKTDYDYSMVFERDWEKDVKAMVDADYNHPSVILYSTGNEISEICTEKGIETSRMLGDRFHGLDPSRYTTNGINGAFAAGDGLAHIVHDITGADPGSGDVNVFMGAMATHMPEIVTHPILSDILEKLETTMDVIGYNYMTARYLKDAKTYPDRVMIGTETYPKQIAQNWAAILQCPAVLGDFTWTGYDYLGEVGPYPMLMNTGADISIIGCRRPMSYYREIVFGLKKGPYIAVQDPDRFGIPREFGPWQFTDCTFNYNYPGREGRPVMIQVYGGGDEVELYVNNRRIGRQPCGRDTQYYTMFNTVYEPGTLTAIAYENGVEIGRCQLDTTGPAAWIRAEADTGFHGHEEMPQIYDGDGNCLTFINITLRDARGRLVPDGENELSVEIQGPAVLLAFGSTGSVHTRGFEKKKTKADQGRAMAVLKSTGQGLVTVIIRGEGLKETVVTYES